MKWKWRLQLKTKVAVAAGSIAAMAAVLAAGGKWK
jgi:hypothetical protein